jgi:sulfur dioxygenase
MISGSFHAPYPCVQESMRSGMLYELAKTPSRRLLFYCAYGERSAMAVQVAHAAGITSACHLQGGIDAWIKAGGELMRPQDPRHRKI